MSATKTKHDCSVVSRELGRVLFASLAGMLAREYTRKDGVKGNIEHISPWQTWVACPLGCPAVLWAGAYAPFKEWRVSTWGVDDRAITEALRMPFARQLKRFPVGSAALTDVSRWSPLLDGVGGCDEGAQGC